MLFLTNIFSPYFGDSTCSCWKKKEKYLKLYDEGADRIERELDLRKLMKNVRNTNILMKQQFTHKDG